MPTFTLRDLSKSWWILVLYGVLAVVFGISAVMQPLAAAAAIAWFFGVLAIAEGLASVVGLFSAGAGVSKGWTLLYALASLAFGVLTVINPLATAGIAVLLLAAWLVVAGIYRIIFAVRVRHHVRGEWLIVLSGVLSIVLGLLFASAPATGLAVTTLWVGIGALFYGVLQIIAGFKLRGIGKVQV